MSQPHDSALVLRFGTVTSTLDVLAQRLDENPDLAPWTTVTAIHQVRGRGRSGRTWVDQDGSALLAATLVQVKDDVLSWTTLVAGLAVARSLGSHGVDADLKWPNDVLVNGRKVCGILCEHLGTTCPAEDPHNPITSVEESPCSHLVAVGVGLNVRHVPAEAGALAGALDVPTTWSDDTRLRESILAAYLHELRELLDRGHPGAWREEYTRRLVGIGQPTTVHSPDASLRHVIPVGVDGDGALVVDEGGTRTLVTVGDVDLPTHPGPLSDPAGNPDPSHPASADDTAPAALDGSGAPTPAPADSQEGAHR
ncbi:biotin--[acetyl-CoA-carboxylase] ligase [Schaalia sp. 19OD2882]|uniref:biotin--[acetyl-CoA-carboxylase] ligase n=1 Tax=Schaalia sp. 19OD2882 TaxID=2794089 RepID=UPI001C1F0234|nr:biotin--[acetyl-CoA-carboxylase] ligase [Schaalia sp. 19OD2882]QWW19409.1 biotin--[acetyl-CoA-carboxylase] ligase [Schaalia sp. 19OD2882]